MEYKSFEPETDLEKENLKSMGITELFYTIQGEGKNIGQPSVFVRTGGCTLSCSYCDTKYSSRPNYKSIIKISNMDDSLEVVNKIVEIGTEGDRNVKSCVFTGGEPLQTHHIDNLSTMVGSLWGSYNIKSVFETTMITEPKSVLFKNKNVWSETIDIWDKLTRFIQVSPKDGVVQFCISPKLDISCYRADVTLTDIFIFYRPNIDCEICEETDNLMTFKIVYYPEIENEILQFVDEFYNYPNLRNSIYIMPYTKFPYSRDEFHESCLTTVDFCKKHSLNYSPREHIYLYDLKKGV